MGEEPVQLDPYARIQTPSGCIPLSAMDPADQRAMATLVAAMKRKWDEMPAEERDEIGRRQAASMARIRERAERRAARAADPYGRLERIAEAHQKDQVAGGMTSGDCAECALPWPCPTNVWAVGPRDPVLSTWDPADDEEANAPAPSLDISERWYPRD